MIKTFTYAFKMHATCFTTSMKSDKTGQSIHSVYNIVLLHGMYLGSVQRFEMRQLFKMDCEISYLLPKVVIYGNIN